MTHHHAPIILTAFGTALLSTTTALAAPTLVQSNAREITVEKRANPVTLNDTKAGNTIIVFHVLDNVDGVTTTDSQGNSYKTCGSEQTWHNGQWYARVDYATNIKGGANTVKANYLSTTRRDGTRFGRVYIQEFAGIDTANPCASGTGSSGSGASANSGSVSSAGAGQLVFGGVAAEGAVVAAGAGFTTATNAYSGLTQYRVTTTSGTVSSTASTTTGDWAAQVAVFNPTGGVVTPPVTANYYVAPNGSDSNPGTVDRPWKTIQKAANTLKAGQTVSVAAGTYNEKVDVNNSGNATAGRITIKAQPGAKVQTFNVDGAYVTIDGFEMTNAKEGYMMYWSGKNGELLNNTIHDTGASWGVVMSRGDNFLARGNRYYDSIGASSDLSVFILDGNNNSLIEDNEIGPAKDIDAFRVWGDHNVIRNNYVHDVTFSNGSDAHTDVIQQFGGGISRNFVFENNLIDNSRGEYLQIFMTEANGGTESRDWDIRNNVFVGVSGQANFGIQNIRFYNNTLYNCGISNNLILYFYDEKGKSNYTGGEVRNNLFVVPSKMTSYSNVIAIGDNKAGVTASNNMITRIGTWGTVYDFKETNGINGGNPQFVNAAANDFHLLSNSPAINRGLTLNGFNDDYDDKPRNGAWDIGAFEYR